MLLAVVLLAGCGAAAQPESSVTIPPASVSPSPAPSVTPSAAPTPAPTVTPAPTPAPTPTPTPSPPPTPSPTPAPFEMNLYGKGDFASQATKDSCVAGAMQTMLLVGDVTSDRTNTYQMELAALALRLSDHPDGGTEPEGWAAGLEAEGLGAYEVEVAPSRNSAILRAARAIRATNRPVGLLVWRGAHSWVMHGFRSEADPAIDPNTVITHVWVSDPWYPRVSSIWGPSNPPNTRMTVASLKVDYLPWRRPTGPYPDKDGRFVIVKPVAG